MLSKLWLYLKKVTIPKTIEIIDGNPFGVDEDTPVKYGIHLNSIEWNAADAKMRTVYDSDGEDYSVYSKFDVPVDTIYFTSTCVVIPTIYNIITGN
ncbi:hypothetical protein IJ707_06440 [bacterium]|nr:hypothetical protein [bacterium]